MQTEIIHVLAILACAALSFLLSGMEAGVLALSQLRILQQQRAGRRAAKVLYRFLDEPENFLWTILIGNTLAMFAFFSVTILVLHGAFQSSLLWFFTVFLAAAFLFYLACDLLPKMLFRQFPNRLCLMLAVPFRTVHVALAPLVAVVEWLSDALLLRSQRLGSKAHVFGSRGELRWVMQQSGPSLTSEERSMISRVLDLQTLSVRSILIPFSQTFSVTKQTPLSEAAHLCETNRVTRLPVWEQNSGGSRVVGVISLRTFLYEPDVDMNAPVDQRMKPALFVHEDMRLEAALRRLQRSGQHLAVVLGRNHREIGIVTLRDVLKVIFGEVAL